MLVNQKPTGTSKSMPIGLAIGWLGEITIAAGLCAACSVCVLNGKMTASSLGYGVMAILILSSFAGTAIAIRQIRRRKMMVCILSGVIYIATLALISTFFFGKQYETICITALLIFGGSVASGFVNNTEKRRKTTRIKR